MAMNERKKNSLDRFTANELNGFLWSIKSWKLRDCFLGILLRISPRRQNSVVPLRGHGRSSETQPRDKQTIYTIQTRKTRCCATGQQIFSFTKKVNWELGLEIGAFSHRSAGPIWDMGPLFFNKKVVFFLYKHFVPIRALGDRDRIRILLSSLSRASR